MNLEGQGIWIWQLKRCCRGDMERLIETCARKNFQHVLIKCVDGARAYRANAECNPYVINRLRDAGISVVGWGFHYGRNPEAEARCAARMCRELGHAAYVCNAEREFENRQGALAARRFVETFRQEARGVALGLSTFALPSLHPKFPWRAFLEGEAVCDFILPQIYTAPSRRHAFLRSLADYWRKADEELSVFGKTIIPTLRAYSGDGVFDWKAIAADAEDFLNRREKEALPAWNWWVWQSAETCEGMWRLLDRGEKS